jgi:hypothetical protein
VLTFQEKTHTSQSLQKHENYSAVLQGDIALVSFAGKRSNRFFVDQVTDVDVSFMK